MLQRGPFPVEHTGHKSDKRCNPDNRDRSWHETFCFMGENVSRHNESAGKRKRGRTCKGNRKIRQLLCEISNAARRTNSQFKGKYKGLVVRRGHKRTIIAIGHKILRIIFVLLKKRVAYKDPSIDYEALLVKRNAPRWIQALKKFGYLLHDDLNPAAC